MRGQKNRALWLQVPMGERSEDRAFLPSNTWSLTLISKESRKGQERKPGASRVIQKSKAGAWGIWLLTQTLSSRFVWCWASYLNLSKPQFPHPSNIDNTTTYYTGWLLGLNERKYGKQFSQCLTFSTCAINMSYHANQRDWGLESSTETKGKK